MKIRVESGSFLVTRLPFGDDDNDGGLVSGAWLNSNSDEESNGKDSSLLLSLLSSHKVYIAP